MGSHKKHKGQQYQSASRKNQQQQQLKQQKGDMQSSQANQTGADEKLNHNVSFLRNMRKEVLVAVLVFVVIGAVAIMALAFNFFFREDSLSLNSSLQETGDGVVVNARRVTTLDHDIVSKNVLLDGSDSVVLSEGKNQQQQDSNSVHPYDSAVFAHVDIELRKTTVHPTLCRDGVTVGFSDWPTLKAAVQEANAMSAERFLRWNQYFATAEGQNFGVFEDGSLYYEDDVIFTICPGATLKSRRGPIYINAENIIIDCEYCIIDVRGTHLSFGPHAKNVLVRGITFRGAQTSSLTFYHDGAEASFEDCYWSGNVGNGKVGAVADVNSTSSVAFYRCEIADTKYTPTRGRGSQTGVASSLTIRGN